MCEHGGCSDGTSGRGERPLTADQGRISWTGMEGEVQGLECNKSLYLCSCSSRKVAGIVARVSSGAACRGLKRMVQSPCRELAVTSRG
jgi:hypothetical protein